MFFSSNRGVNESLFLGSNNTMRLEDFSRNEIMEGIGHVLVHTSRYLGAYFIDVFMILSSITLWLGVNQFVKETISDEGCEEKIFFSSIKKDSLM